MTTKISFQFPLKSGVGVPGANQNKHKLSNINTVQLSKKPNLSLFDQLGSSPDEHQSVSDFKIWKNFPPTHDKLSNFQLHAMSDPKQVGVGAWQNLAIKAGATRDHVNPRKIIKSTATGTRASPRSRQSSRHSSISNASSHSGSTRTRGTRITNSLICFWGGVLSNWNQGAHFSGQRAMDLLQPRLNALNLTTAYPSSKRFATKLLCTHNFSCGEQWMMACKAWLFETSVNNLAKSEWQFLPQGEFEQIRHRLMLATPPQDPQEKAMWGSCLCRILRASHPKDHKDIGRSTPNFNEEIWTKANMPIVVAGCIARAEKDDALAAIYNGNKEGKRGFVEGSPYDRIWGVGISWDHRGIEDRRNWKGENRLGMCHDEACRAFVAQKIEGVEEKAGTREWGTADDEGWIEGSSPVGAW